MKTEELNVKEVELFKAVDRWATEQSKRQGITPDGESKRRILGEEIVKAIRFPLMSQQEFASVVIDSDILTLKEVGDLVKHYNGVLTSSLPFLQAPRKDSSIVHRCPRFLGWGTPWEYGTSPDCIDVSVNKPIMLHGVQLFGSKAGNYMVSTEVKDTEDGSSLVKQSGAYASEKDKSCSFYGFYVQFDRPVRLVQNVVYKLESLINGPSSWRGAEGQKFVESEGVVFTFYTSLVDNNGTDTEYGQFPVLFWSRTR